MLTRGWAFGKSMFFMWRRHEWLDGMWEFALQSERLVVNSHDGTLPFYMGVVHH